VACAACSVAKLIKFRPTTANFDQSPLDEKTCTSESSRVDVYPIMQV
jgi:hypothetical protein